MAMIIVILSAMLVLSLTKNKDSEAEDSSGVTREEKKDLEIPSSTAAWDSAADSPAAEEDSKEELTAELTDSAAAADSTNSAAAADSIDSIFNPKTPADSTASGSIPMPPMYNQENIAE